MMYIPSYDFNLFKIPNFSSLGAQEFNAMTEFSANTPLSYVDYSLNQLAGLTQPNNAYPYPQNQFPAQIIPYDLQPYFQDTPSAAADRLRKLRDQANVILGETPQDKVSVPQSKSDCPPGFKRVTPLGITWLSYCGKELHSDDRGAVKESDVGLGSFEKFMNALPQGSGIFLIALVVIILLFLFVRK